MPLRDSVAPKMLLCLFASMAWGDSGVDLAALRWEEVGRFNGVRVSSAEFPGSSVLAFKGEGELDAPIGKLVTVIRDMTRKHEWVDRFREGRVVREIGPGETLEYLVARAPWPLHDRDALYRARVSAEPGRVLIDIASVEDPEVPVAKGLVRAQVRMSRFELFPMEGGGKTRISAVIHSDPRGWIPKFIVNIAQKTWPRKTLAGLLRQVAKPDIAEHPLAAVALATVAPALAGEADRAEAK